MTDVPEEVNPAASPLSGKSPSVKSQEWANLHLLLVSQFHYFVPSAAGLIRKLLMDKQNQNRRNFYIKLLVTNHI